MKTIKSLFGILPLLLLALPAALQAQFTYVTTNGTITITGYTGPGGAVTIPSTINSLPVTTIASYTFANKTSLTSVAIPNSVIAIGHSAFSGCANLNSITVDALNPSYSSLTGVLFDKSQTTLIAYPAGKGAIYTVPNSATSIGDFAFQSCTSLNSVTMNTGITSIGIEAFYGCTGLTNVAIPSTVTNIGDAAFYACSSLTSVAVPNSVTSMGDSAFAYCSGLTGLTIPNSLNSIGGSIFEECFRLTSLTIPNSLTNIGDAAFAGCYGLTGLKFPNSLISIGENAFGGCSGLPSVTIPNSVVNIGVAAFAGCPSLSAITVDALNPVYSSVAGVLYDKGQTTLIEYPAGKAPRYTVPNSVTSIGASAFAACARLTSVIIPNSVTNIDDHVFASCTLLTSVYFEGNAPASGLGEFASDYSNPIVYYLPGATGWGTTFGGNPAVPVVLWNPLAQSVAVQGNHLGFMITGTTNIPIVIEASTNLPSSGWTSLQSCTLTNGSIYFSDPAWINYPSRFYRIRSP